MGLTDIHNHILPGVDDGSPDIETSKRMLQLAASDGITDIILTPHNKPRRHNVSVIHMDESMRELQNYCDSENLGLTLYKGNEVYYRQGVIDEIESGTAFTMADSHYVLTEFNPMDDYEYIKRGLYEIISGGYYPIIAHVERYKCIYDRPERVSELIKMGCYIQLNADTVTGSYGFGYKRFAKKLLKNGEVHFVGSDAHDMDKRQPLLEDCARYIAKKYGSDYAWEIFEDNPYSIVHDRII